MKRCLFCDRRVWPWQHKGHYVGVVFTIHWHAACRAARPV